MSTPIPAYADLAGTPSNAVFKAAIGALRTFINERILDVASGTVSIPKGVYTPTVTVAFSGTPTLDASLGNVFEIGTLTANLTTLTISNANAGQSLVIRVVQDGTGSRTVVDPTGSLTAGSVNQTASKVSIGCWTYSLVASRWEGSWTQLP
jgi:hypothetical protein